MIFLILGGQIHDFWVILGAQGLILEAWGSILQSSRIFVILGTFSARNTQALFEVKMRPRTHFLQCCFSMFFWVPTFLDFLWFGVPGGSILAPFRLLFGSLLKNSWKCVTIVKFRGLAPSRRSLVAGLEQERVLRRSLSRFLWFYAFLRFPFGRIFTSVVVKKQVWEKWCEKWPKMGIRVKRRKTCWRLWAP